MLQNLCQEYLKISAPNQQSKDCNENIIFKTTKTKISITNKNIDCEHGELYGRPTAQDTDRRQYKTKRKKGICNHSPWPPWH